MAERQRRGYLICYDIADPKRLHRVHRLLSTHALPVQYSVFAARLNRKELQRLLSLLGRRIDAKHDDVRVYGLPERCRAVSVGRQFFGEGTLLFAEENELLHFGERG